MGTEPKKTKAKVSRTRHVIGVFSLGILGLVFASFALGAVGNFEIVSDSMAPTLVKGDRVLVNQRHNGHVQVGDVVALEDPLQPGGLLTKRVAAVEGQEVQIVGRYVVIDGKRWAPPGRAPLPVPEDLQFRRARVGDDQVFVLGDNVGRSEDSLYFGPVPASSIRGKLIVKYWPPVRAGLIR
jgi:signal peptidase I